MLDKHIAFLQAAPTSYAGLSQAFQRSTSDAGEEPAKLLERYHLWLATRETGRIYNDAEEVERYCQMALAALPTEPPSGLKPTERIALARRPQQLWYALGEAALLRGDTANADNCWQQLSDPKLRQWSQWLRARQLCNAGAEPDRIVAAYRSLRPVAGTLLWLEQHWAIFQLHAAQGDLSQACDALVPMLATAPEYRGVAEEAHKFFTVHGLWNRAFTNARQECIRTGSADWADRSVRLLEGSGFDRPGTLADYRPLLASMLGAGLYPHWVRLLQAIQPILVGAPSELQSLIEHVNSQLADMELAGTTLAGLAPLLPLLQELTRACQISLAPEYRMGREPDLVWHQMRIAAACQQPGLAYEAATWLQVLGDRWGGVAPSRMQRAAGVTTTAAPTVAGQLTAYPWAAQGARMLTVLDHHGYTSDAHSALAAGLAAREFRLFVCGTFTNGKSSLLNLLMDEALLKTTALPTTATLVFLRHGERACARWSPEDGAGWTTLPWEQLPGLSTFTHGETEAARRDLIEIRLPAPLLSEMALVDTPGFGDLGEQAELIFSHLGLADKLLIVLDAGAPLRSSEAQTIRRLAESVPASRMAFVLNKMDRLDEDERPEVAKYVCRTLESILGERPLLLPFSVREARRNPAARASLLAFVAGLRPGALDQFRLEHFAQLMRAQVADLRQLLQKERDGGAANVALLEETQRTLEHEKAELQKYRGEAQRVVWQQAEAIQHQIRVKVQEGVPGHLALYREAVVQYTNYKTLRDELETVVSPALDKWAQKTLHAALERLISQCIAEQEHAYRALLHEAEPRGAAREAALKRHPALASRVQSPMGFRPWEQVHSDLVEASGSFLAQRSYRVQVLDEVGFFSGVFRGVSSLFSGDASVLNDVRQDMRRQLTTGGQRVAERIQTNAFAGFEALEASWEQSLLGESHLLARLITDDLRAASSAVAASQSEMAAKAADRVASLTELDRLEIYVDFWAKQVQVGIVYANGELYRAV